MPHAGQGLIKSKLASWEGSLNQLESSCESYASLVPTQPGLAGSHRCIFLQILEYFIMFYQTDRLNISLWTECGNEKNFTQLLVGRLCTCTLARSSSGQMIDCPSHSRNIISIYGKCMRLEKNSFKLSFYCQSFLITFAYLVSRAIWIRVIDLTPTKHI